MKETVFTKNYMNELKTYGIWFFKVHGHLEQTKGVPDVVACIDSKFVGIEFKVKRGSSAQSLNISMYQEYQMNEITKANGWAFVIFKNMRTGEICVDVFIDKGEYGRAFTDVSIQASVFNLIGLIKGGQDG